MIRQPYGKKQANNTDLSLNETSSRKCRMSRTPSSSPAGGPPGAAPWAKAREPGHLGWNPGSAVRQMCDWDECLKHLCASVSSAQHEDNKTTTGQAVTRRTGDGTRKALEQRPPPADAE